MGLVKTRRLATMQKQQRVKAAMKPPRMWPLMLTKSKQRRKEKYMSRKPAIERRDVWVYQPGIPLENTPLEIRVTEPGNDKKLIGRLYISKGGIIWCNRSQRYAGKRGWSWEYIAKHFAE